MPSLKLEPAVASHLVNLLATDDHFRARFTASPEAALLEAGHVPADPAELTQFVNECCCNIHLADKNVIVHALPEIVGMLTSGTAFNVPMLENGYNGSAPRTLR
ncbi:putative modified peptide [Stenotrophomonas sp. S48]|uniref:NHLP-related RiPP peptide n=1 Tax=unclassified Stenotrophomonas TaxID=196198 RepID=UPI0019025406|nr:MULTISPECIES: NHLP-related RiPP peptide [unclassified Stenotrophomonas]MBK0025123.1 putative modified peptide [Stenotrophomonas sp. S48]MBK0046836.1 putative modified peptide [Stenotrophomonas sp. S49]